MRKKSLDFQNLAYRKQLATIYLQRAIVVTALLFCSPAIYYSHLKLACFPFRYSSLSPLNTLSWQDYFDIDFAKKVAFLSACLLCAEIIFLLIINISFNLYYKLVYAKEVTNTGADKHCFLSNANEYSRFHAAAAFLRQTRWVSWFIGILFASYIAYIILISTPVLKQEFDATMVGKPIGFSVWLSICLIYILITIIPSTVGIMILITIHNDRDSLERKCMNSDFAHCANLLLDVDFDSLTGVEFEEYCAVLLSQLGYEHVSYTATSHDQGIDLTAYKSGIKYGIQCKRHNNAVGNSAVQEVTAGLSFYKCQKGIVMTTNHFTPAAKALAAANNIELIDRTKLLDLINSVALSTINSTNLREVDTTTDAEQDTTAPVPEEQEIVTAAENNAVDLYDSVIIPFDRNRKK